MTYSLLSTRLAEEKKEEGNQLYKLKSYRDALAKYSEAIGKFFLQLDTSIWKKDQKIDWKKDMHVYFPFVLSSFFGLVNNQ